MSAKRIARHLWKGGLHVRRIFPADALEKITQAVAASEAAHSGEIRFAVEASLDPLPLLKGVTARTRAVQVFSELGVWDTEANNGVLIYLLLADRDVEIIADRGIHAKVGADGWEKICRAMEERFRTGDFVTGVLRGIEAVGAHLQTHFPRDGRPDINELPDQPVIL